MTSVLIERRLRLVGRRLVQLRTDLAVAEEHLAHFSDDSDEARLRSLVSETPQSSIDQRAAERQLSVMARHRDELVDTIARLEEEQDELLDRLSARRRA